MKSFVPLLFLALAASVSANDLLVAFRVVDCNGE
jgi:hypothetical protein